jgi:serine/threonine protein kinase
MISGSLVGGKYRLIRQIGEGAMGVVWSAVNEMTSRTVAIKFILRSSDDLRHRLFREAKACGSINHRNIVESLDMGQTSDGDPFLVMQLLTGETLEAILERKRRLAPNLASQIGRDVARALAAAHEAKIIHRDLKPANIFLHQEPGTEGHVVKVLDFGVSKNLAACDNMATIANGAVGTPAYMSPEQYRVAPDLDARTDIWSFGVMFFEMLTGVRPFDGSTQDIMMKVLFGEIPLVSRFVRTMDPGLVELVSRCLERDRAARIDSAVDIANFLSGHAEVGEASNGLTEARTRDTEAVSTAIPQSEARRSRPSFDAIATQPAALRPSFAALQSPSEPPPDTVAKGRPTSEPEKFTASSEARPSVFIASEPGTRNEGHRDALPAQPAPAVLKPPSGAPMIVVRGPTTSTAPMIRRVQRFDATLVMRNLRQEKPEETHESAGRGLLLAVLTSLGGLIVTIGVVTYVFVSPETTQATAIASSALDRRGPSLRSPASVAPPTSQPVLGAPQRSPSAVVSGAPAAATTSTVSSSPPSSSASAPNVGGAHTAAGAGADPRSPRVTPSANGQPIRPSGPVNITPKGSMGRSN